MSASPKRKPHPQPQQQQQQRQPPRIGPIGALSSPKFSFRAALVQHKASKLASKTSPASSESPTSNASISADASIVSQYPRYSQTSSVGRPIRGINTSSIPSLSGRGRFNSASTDSTFASSLTTSKDDEAISEATRAISSLGKHPMEAAVDHAGDSSMMSDFGPVTRKSSNLAGGSIGKGVGSASTRSHPKTSRLPGLSSTRAHASASLKSISSPTMSKAPSKVARPDGIAEVHAASVKALPVKTLSPASARSNFGSVRNRTMSALEKPPSELQQSHKPKIGTLPKLKSKAAPIKTLLDERPIHRSRPSMFAAIANNAKDELDSDHDQEEHNTDDDDSEEENEDSLEGPDVSRIRTRRPATQRPGDTLALQRAESTPISMLPPSSTDPTSSKIPSIGRAPVSTTASRPQRRSSSVSLAIRASASEKENVSQIAAPSRRTSRSQRPSIDTTLGTQRQPRSSLPLAVSQPLPQAKVEAAGGDDTASNNSQEKPNTAVSDPADPIPVSPSKLSSLSALRSRGLQTDSANAIKPRPSTESVLPSRSNRQDLGIKSSIVRANPAHPSIVALQAARPTQHQPISTPEALTKAKKRFSGALLNSSTSSSSVSAAGSFASPSERISILARSSSMKQGLQSKMPYTPRTGPKQSDITEAVAVVAMTPSTSTSFLPWSAPRSPIKSSLLLFPATLREEAPQPASANSAKSPTQKTFEGTKETIIARGNGDLSSSEIDANLLASLRVVAQKANLKVGDLLEEERRQHVQQEAGSFAESSQADGPSQYERSRRDASEEFVAGDVSVDLMAFDLTVGSPVSEVSILRSPMGTGASAYLDTPPSVSAARTVPTAAVTGTEVGDDHAKEEASGKAQETAHVNEDDTDTSCASPSLRAAAALRLPRRPGAASDDNAAAVAETPERHRGYRNVPLIPSTPTSNAASGHSMSPTKSNRAYPPSAAMSAKSRTRLKRALRESLNLEAHFASIRLGSNSGDKVIVEKLTALQGGEERVPLTDAGPLGMESARKEESDMRKSISAILLTEDDRYLDELVSAVARIGLEDLAPDATPTDHQAGIDDQFQGELASPTQILDVEAASPESQLPSSAISVQLSAALKELSTLREQLQLSQLQTSELETQRVAQLASSTRTARTQAILEADLTALKSELAGTEWEKARSSWARAKVEALAELEDAKVQKDAMLVLGSQLGVWERMIRARA